MNVKTLSCATCLAVCLAAVPVAAAKKAPKSAKTAAEVPAVDLFDAIDQGTIEASVIPRDAHRATVFLTNRSDAPVSVRFPKAVAAVQVLQQRFAQRGANTPGNGFPTGNGQQPGGGAAQPLGGGAVGQGNGNPMNFLNQGNNNNNNNNFFNPNGNGFANVRNNGIFSVASQQTVQVPLTTVCLAHGLPQPRPRLRYELVKIEDYSKDPLLHETLKAFVAGAVDVETAQAAAWHLTDNMSWGELKAKLSDQLGAVEPTPFFDESKVNAAAELISRVQAQIQEPRRETETAGR